MKRSSKDNLTFSCPATDSCTSVIDGANCFFSALQGVNHSIPVIEVHPMVSWNSLCESHAVSILRSRGLQMYIVRKAQLHRKRFPNPYHPGKAAILEEPRDLPSSKDVNVPGEKVKNRFIDTTDFVCAFISVKVCRRCSSDVSTRSFLSVNVCRSGV